MRRGALRHTALASLTLVLSACASGAAAERDAPVPGDDVPAGYELAFYDDFSDDRLDSAWSTCYWWQTDGGCTIGSNDEAQWYRPEGVRLSDGVLELTATESEHTTPDGDVLSFQSGMVSTGHVDNDVVDPGFSFTYGYVEARVRFPVGAGTWPAVWLLSAARESLPEIDVMEWYGERPDLVTSHVHNRVDGERSSARLEHVVDGAEGAWHDVAVNWTSERVEFFFDGEPIGTIDDEELVPQSPMYLIFNLALGGPAGDVDLDALPTSFAVDWVQVWQEATS